MSAPNYQELFERACERKGGEAAVEAMLPKVASKKQLKNLQMNRPKNSVKLMNRTNATVRL